MRLRLPESVMHHVRVLRLKQGDAFALFDGNGGEFSACLDMVTRDEAHASIGAHRALERESPIEVLLAQALSSGDHMDYTVEKAVELGVTQIQPLAAARSVVQLSGERALRRVAHWQSLAVAACEQCGRNRVPQVMPVSPLVAWLAALDQSAGTRLLLSTRAKAPLKSVSPQLERPIALLAGPEGGFSESEEQAAIVAGFVPVLLGPRVLRTETAAASALACMQTLWGDF